MRDQILLISTENRGLHDAFIVFSLFITFCFVFCIFLVFFQFFFCFVCFSVKLRWKRSENFTSVQRLFVFVERRTSLHVLCLLELRNININNNNYRRMKMREIRLRTTQANDVFIFGDLEFVSTVRAGGGVGLHHLRMTSSRTG